MNRIDKQFGDSRSILNISYILLVDLVTLDDLSAAAMLESSARIETLANAWDQINSEPPLAAP